MQHHTRELHIHSGKVRRDYYQQVNQELQERKLKRQQIDEKALAREEKRRQIAKDLRLMQMHEVITKWRIGRATVDKIKGDMLLGIL